MLSYGYFQGDFKLLNKYVHQFGNNPGFPSFYQTVGIDLVVPMGGRSSEQNASFTVEMILPEKIHQSDSITFRTIGWHFITTFWEHDFTPNKPKLSFILAPGIDWGELYLRQTNNATHKDYTNPMIAPLVRTEFRVIVHPFAFGIRALYRYDISSPRWKLYSDNSSGLAHTRFSGLGFEVFVGYGKCHS